MSSLPSFVLNSGRRIPAMSFGTGTSFKNRGDDVRRLTQEAYKAGFRSFDGACIYETEEGLGEGLTTIKDDRSAFFVTTKTPDWAWSQEDIEKEVRISLTKLKLEYVDLVLIHSPAPRLESQWVTDLMPAEAKATVPDPMDAEAMDKARLTAWLGLQNCVKLGLVRDIGVSNYTVSHLKNLLKHPEVTIKPAINQVEYNPYLVDKAMYDFCKSEGILVQAFAPLGNGKDLLSDPVMLDIAQKKGKTAAQIALRWAYQMNIPTVTKTETVSRLAENLHGLDETCCLNDLEMEAITGLNKNLRMFGDYARFP